MAAKYWHQIELPKEKVKSLTNKDKVDPNNPYNRYQRMLGLSGGLTRLAQIKASMRCDITFNHPSLWYR